MAGTIIVVAVALIVTARGRMRAPRAERLEPEVVDGAAVTLPRPVDRPSPDALTSVPVAGRTLR